MSETPTLPQSDVKTIRIVENADRILNDTYESAAFFTRAEQQVAPQTSQERWDLNEPVQVFNPDQNPTEAATYALPPEYVAAPKTRAQEIEETLFYYTDKQKAEYAYSLSRAIPMMRRLV